MWQSEMEPWVRFHSLPGSKRYATSDAERKSILSRARILAQRILGRGPAWVADLHLESSEFEWTPYVLRPAMRFVDEDGMAFAIRAGLVEWEGEPFDALVVAISDDIGPRTLWMSPKDGAVFAPYDGGFDLFPGSEEAAAALRGEFPQWLSRHPSGR